MKIENEGIFFSEELYLNYFYQFGKRVAQKYRIRTLTFEHILNISLQQAIWNHSLKIYEKIFKDLHKKK